MLVIELGGSVAISRLPHSGQAAVTTWTNSALILSLYGTAHVVVDAICAAVVFSIASTRAVAPDTFVSLLVLYHVLAFGLQAIIGLAVDAARRPRMAAALGCLISASALLFQSSPMFAVVLAGLGNATFHVGGGIISLRLTPWRATAPGLFVAPGSLGLLLGAILGKTGQLASASLLPAVVVLCLFMARTEVPKDDPVAKTRRSASRGELILGLILLSIAVRALLGFLVTFPWETHPVSLIVLTLAIVFGKAVGGIIADRWGWVRVGVGSTIAALPFLICGAMYPLAAIPGVLLLNLTMPITLAATAEAVPGHPGFAFGLTCLAFLAGAIPALLGVVPSGPLLISLVVLLSSLALFRGLRLVSFDYSCREAVHV